MLFTMCAKHKVATLSAYTKRERERVQEPHTDIPNLAPLGDNTKSNYSPHKASGVELKPPLSAHRAGRKKSALRASWTCLTPARRSYLAPHTFFARSFVRS